MTKEERSMVAPIQKDVKLGDPAKEKDTHEHRSGDACRCREVSEMPPKKLLGLMISDLAFWKKLKKG
jgi:hypothetical protein